MTAVYVETRGEGPDLVMLHGWALHGGSWGPWLDGLAARNRLHLVDLPGHGRSPWPDHALSLHELARAVSPSVPAGAAILGWSLGGLVALELARQRGADVAALVLLATTPRFLVEHDWPSGMEPATLQGFAAGLAGDYRRTVANFLALQTWGDEHATAALRSLRASLAAHGEPDPRALRAGLEILREADLRDALSQVAAPALVIAGEHDRITPAAAGRALAARLPSARYREIAKAGHAPFLSHGDEVLREVEGFLSSLPRPAPSAPGAAARRLPGAFAARRATADDPFALDGRRVRHSFSDAARTYDSAAALQARIRDELLERLDLLTMRPRTVVDLGAGTGRGAAALRHRYREATVVALDNAPGMLVEAGRRQGLFRRFHRVGGDAAALPLQDATTDMIFSSLLLQWCNDPDRVLRECRRVLRPGGVLHLATLGPDTLTELRRAWQVADPDHVHVSRFLDMHDVGDALVRAGFAEPVLDVERHTLAYGDARDLMRDLKAIGAHNATVGRSRGLTGKGVLARMLAAYETARRDGRLPATYEVVFAQAWAPEHPVPGRPADEAGEVLVPLSRLRRR
ncbi:MAG TPA: pimeloyl-ACP methyl ester esterase BioH [Steroidobacteraceae bacterium]|nr:pimeloyl-ACP methyl ester esterase BioH [Steroidobacteraceae bacterium]